MLAESPLALPVDSTPVALAAEMYAQIGFMVVPLYGATNGRCGCGNGECGRSIGKHPISADWQKRASADVDEVREAFRGHRGNIGIMLGTKYVAVDVDGPEGFESLAKLGNLPETLTSRSGSGGEHRIFAYAVHQSAGEINNRRFMPGLDAKTRAGQVVVAPSMHRHGERYRWTVPVPTATLPDSLYEIMRTPTRRAVPVGSAPASKLYDRAKAYLDRIEPGVSGSRGHDQTFAAARAVTGWIKKGLSQDDAWSLLCEYNKRCQPPCSEKELRHKFEQAHSAHTVPDIQDRPIASVTPIRPDVEPEPAPHDDWRAHLVWENTNRGNRPTKHAENAIVVLRYHPAWIGRVRLDVHAQTVTVRNPPWHESDKPAETEPERPWADSDSVRLSSWIRRELNLDLSVSDCDRAVGVAAESLPYHPVRDWMESLVWDQTLRVDRWLSTYLGVPPSEYAKRIGKWWLIAAVARTFRPGCKVDNVLILEGVQGIKKGSALKILASPQWFSDTPLDLQSKDAYLALQGRLIVELAELDSLRRTESTRAKAFFSSDFDTYRPPYGRRTVRVPRGCVFAGTTNQTTYLQDRTGNRRFWPVTCGAIDLAALERDREQLWAEAVWWHREGAQWWPETEDDRRICENEQAPRGESDEWEARVATYLARAGGQRVTVGDLLGGALDIPVGQWGRPEQIRVGIILSSLGWVRRRESTGTRPWFYERPSENPSNRQ